MIIPARLGLSWARNRRVKEVPLVEEVGASAPVGRGEVGVARTVLGRRILSPRKGLKRFSITLVR
ncbi:MAG: hypothetical protein ABSB29_00470 [Nitrososphaerales archaeon]